MRLFAAPAVFSLRIRNLLPLSHRSALRGKRCSACSAEAASGRYLRPALGAFVFQLRPAVVAEFGAGRTLGFAGGANHHTRGQFRPGVSHHHRAAAGDDALLNHLENLLRQLFLLVGAHTGSHRQRSCDKPSQRAGADLIRPFALTHGDV